MHIKSYCPVQQQLVLHGDDACEGVHRPPFKRRTANLGLQPHGATLAHCHKFVRPSCRPCRSSLSS